MTEDRGIDLQVAKPVGHIAMVTAISMDKEQMSRQPFPYYLSPSYFNWDKPFTFGWPR